MRITSDKHERMTTYSEIGSEYWLSDACQSQGTEFIPARYGFVGDVLFPLSGRTAIRCIIDDLQNCNQPIKKAYLPAYCCDSMVCPFAHKGVEVVFYDGQPVNKPDVDLLYVNNYFGYSTEIDLEVVKRYKDQGKTIVYDRTHALLLENDTFTSWADYSFSSFRKWMDVPVGAVLCKHNGAFCKRQLKLCDYVAERIKAMQLKADYLSGKEVTKEKFFFYYNAFAHRLTEDYADYAMDPISKKRLQNTDFNWMRQQRLANIEVLYEGLKDNLNITLWCEETERCLLFFPIVCRNKDERDGLRQHLTRNKVYCPVHWPKGEWVKQEYQANTLLDCELSLICDQRYHADDMQYIIELIQEYFNNKI